MLLKALLHAHIFFGYAVNFARGLNLLCNSEVPSRERARAIEEGMQTIPSGVGHGGLEQGTITIVLVENNGHKGFALLGSRATLSVMTKAAMERAGLQEIL